jgi:NitT/TauT family transport system permease protein
VTDAIRTYDTRPAASRPAWLVNVWQATWKQGLIAAVAWAAAALATIALPDVVPWGSAALFVKITAGAAVEFVALAFVVHRLGRVGERLVH